MSETKKALSTGQVESAEECAGARIEGERNSNPSKIVYTNEQSLSSIREKVFQKLSEDDIDRRNCVKCGKPYAYIRIPYDWKDCCSHPCWLHRNDYKDSGFVKMFTQKGKYIASMSLEDAAKLVGHKTTSSIKQALNGKAKSSAGFLWIWSEKEN